MSTISTPAPAATCPMLTGTIDELLAREWLLTDGLGGFASGTVIGCPTRRYHGLLVAPKRPPLERHLLLAGTLDRVVVRDVPYDLSTFEFNGVFHPTGYRLLSDFEMDIAQPNPWVEFRFTHELFELRKRLTLLSGLRAARLNYELTPRKGHEVRLEVSPLVALRGFHGVRRKSPNEPWQFHSEDDAAWFHSREDGAVTLAVVSGSAMKWHPQPVWWEAFRYRAEFDRGFQEWEDLLNAGAFRAQGRSRFTCELTAVGMADCLPNARKVADQRPEPRPRAVPASAVLGDDPVVRRLAVAADQFVVRRGSTGGQAGTATILAGYPWFGDWGRDSFIALEGLLLIPERFAEARQVLATFAGAQRDGLIPNRFDDYGGECAYNSVDASLWFIHAADAYLRYTDDNKSWDGFLGETCRQVIEHFCRGTHFDIRVDGDGLVCCGNADTQITWMDAKCNGLVFTPRHGRPVEVNALWYHALHILAERFADADPALHESCTDLIAKIDKSFVRTFWNQSAKCLYDCVRDGEVDDAVRPNQIFAVSLAHSPLPMRLQKAVVEAVAEQLLTPYGLRTLSPEHLRYIGRYQGDCFERDRAYHNGTVWAWPIGAFVEAHLRVHHFGLPAKTYARRLLKPLVAHLDEAGLGSISEIFDGDQPHAPRGCPAQAWSVAELLRAWHLTRDD